MRIIRIEMIKNSMVVESAITPFQSSSSNLLLSGVKYIATDEATNQGIANVIHALRIFLSSAEITNDTKSKAGAQNMTNAR